MLRAIPRAKKFFCVKLYARHQENAILSKILGARELYNIYNMAHKKCLKACTVAAFTDLIKT